jgi:hypothetical protein
MMIERAALAGLEQGCGQSIDPRHRRQRLMKQMLKLAAISVALTVNFGTAYTQNMPSPKPEDAERDAFQTPTVGKNAPAPTENSEEGRTDKNPESRLNDDPQLREGVDLPNTAPK